MRRWDALRPCSGRHSRLDPRTPPRHFLPQVCYARDEALHLLLPRPGGHPAVQVGLRGAALAAPSRTRPLPLRRRTAALRNGRRAALRCAAAASVAQLRSPGLGSVLGELGLGLAVHERCARGVLLPSPFPSLAAAASSSPTVPTMTVHATYVHLCMHKFYVCHWRVCGPGAARSTRQPLGAPLRCVATAPAAPWHCLLPSSLPLLPVVTTLQVTTYTGDSNTILSMRCEGHP